MLPAMTNLFIDTCCREAARVLTPSGYLMRWIDTFGLCEAHHLRIADIIKCVDLIAWDNCRIGNGYRSRRRGDYLLVLQKKPVAAQSTWRDHGLRDQWLLSQQDIQDWVRQHQLQRPPEQPIVSDIAM